MQEGTKIKAKVTRVVDGDTIRVVLPGMDQDESLRLLTLDTEESNAGSSKPVTPWGKKAKEEAESIFSPGDEVELEFPGMEDVKTCLQRYRGNYGRLLVFLRKGKMDYQEYMIRKGYSPYFSKYGYAQIEPLHYKYVEAERLAQIEGIGVWNQMEVNGAEMRNYAALSTWWNLRARIIEEYRLIAGQKKNLYNTRLDFMDIQEAAEKEETARVFTELRHIRMLKNECALIEIGSREHPFNLFMRDVDRKNCQDILRLLQTRYITDDDSHPKRSYAYIEGKLELYKGQAEIVLSSLDQIRDTY